jgi:hypothetical protein
MRTARSCLAARNDRDKRHSIICDRVSDPADWVADTDGHVCEVVRFATGQEGVCAFGPSGWVELGGVFEVLQGAAVGRTPRSRAAMHV